MENWQLTRYLREMFPSFDKATIIAVVSSKPYWTEHEIRELVLQFTDGCEKQRKQAPMVTDQELDMYDIDKVNQALASLSDEKKEDNFFKLSRHKINRSKSKVDAKEESDGFKINTDNLDQPLSSAAENVSTPEFNKKISPKTKFSEGGTDLEEHKTNNNGNETDDGNESFHSACSDSDDENTVRLDSGTQNSERFMSQDSKEKYAINSRSVAEQIACSVNNLKAKTDISNNTDEKNNNSNVPSRVFYGSPCQNEHPSSLPSPKYESKEIQKYSFEPKFPKPSTEQGSSFSYKSISKDKTNQRIDYLAPSSSFTINPTKCIPVNQTIADVARTASVKGTIDSYPSYADIVKEYMIKNKEKIKKTEGVENHLTLYNGIEPSPLEIIAKKKESITDTVVTATPMTSMIFGTQTKSEPTPKQGKKFSNFSKRLKEKQKSESDQEVVIKPKETKASMDTRNLSEEQIIQRYFLKKPIRIEDEPKKKNEMIVQLDNSGDKKRESSPTIPAEPSVTILKEPVQSKLHCDPSANGHYFLKVQADMITNLPEGNYFIIPMDEYIRKGLGAEKISQPKQGSNEATSVLKNNISVSMDDGISKKIYVNSEDDDDDNDDNYDYNDDNDVDGNASQLNQKCLGSENNLSYKEKNVSVKSPNNWLHLFDQPSHDIGDELKVNYLTIDNSPINTQKIQNSITKLVDKKPILEEQMEIMKASFPHMDQNLIQIKVENCGGNTQQFASMFVRELEISQKVQEDNQQLRNELEHLKRRVPHLDPTYVEQQWAENLIGSKAKQDQFVITEMRKKEVDDLFHHLLQELPHLLETDLQRKSNELLGDPVAVDLYIQEEKQSLVVEQQLQFLKAELPDVDMDELKRVVDSCGGNDVLVMEYCKKQEEKRNCMLAAMSILSDVEPSYLLQVWNNTEENANEFNRLISECLETGNYPKIEREEPTKRNRAILWDKYITNFSVDEYLRYIKDPVDKFITNAEKTPVDIKIITHFLNDRYNDVEGDLNEDFENTFYNNNSNLTLTCQEMSRSYEAKNRILFADYDQYDLTERFLQEVSFILHKDEIARRIEELDQEKELLIAIARADNTLLQCPCCCDDLLPQDAVECPAEHFLCPNCLIKSCEIKIGEGSTSIKCLSGDCERNFSPHVLSTVLPPNLMHQLEVKQQMEEVQKAQVPGLESCSYCLFSYIPAPDAKIFACENPDCMKQVCRSCKELAHIPLRCNEVERPKDTEVRKKIEESMSESLFRTCHNCGKKYVKLDGCNKMTCECGALQCYLCRKPVTDYAHFNGNGGTHYNRCPLFSDNNDLHHRVVREAGIRARDNELQANPEVHLVHDPTNDF